MSNSPFRDRTIRDTESEYCEARIAATVIHDEKFFAFMHIGNYNSNMQSYIPRTLTEDLERRLRTMPVVAVLGPRQCGKSTLAHAVISLVEKAVHLDLERASDLNKFQDPEAFFHLNAESLICLDEIQRQPALFPQLRVVAELTAPA